jgi:hypothetical protein
MTDRHRKTRAAQVIVAGAAAVAALALFSTSPPVDTKALIPAVSAPFATDDTNFVNDNGQTSGDIFTQNAQDQN